MVGPVSDKNITIIIRGDLFRGCSKTNQSKALASIVKHAIGPLNIPPGNINVVAIANEHDDLEGYKEIIRDIFKDYNFYLWPRGSSSQVHGFIDCFNIVNNHYTELFENILGVLVLRLDLYFFSDIDYTRISPDKILMQWNLLHSKSTGHVPDQIQYIGGNLIHDFINTINNSRIDTSWPGTLHNIFNYCTEHFGSNKISYLNYYDDPKPGWDNCPIRGNPGILMGNPLFTYTRYLQTGEGIPYTTEWKYFGHDNELEVERILKEHRECLKNNTRINIKNDTS